MGIERLSTNALNRLVNGAHQNAETCVVKFYSNGCHYCHALKDIYLQVQMERASSGIHFFAFNVDDIPGDTLDKLMPGMAKINGVPSIAIVKTGQPAHSRVRLLEDPDNPDGDTFYTRKEISDFIDSEAVDLKIKI
tara:strand:+ start:141 stop:548 length:408 start_codon:yes stop_codon:yes gene_type:complete